jgi:hypothetical protein
MAALVVVYLPELDSCQDSTLFVVLCWVVRRALVMIRGIEDLLSLSTYLDSAVDFPRP